MKCRNRVKILESRYYVNPEKNTVVCVLRCTPQINTSLYETDVPVFEVRGKAKCSPHDTFDPVTGQRIALSRAKVKMYEYAALYHLDNAEEYRKLMEYTISLSEACDHAKEAEQNHIDELIL